MADLVHSGAAAALAAPALSIGGGLPFFLPQAGEQAIPGPVFARGRGPGPLLRIESGCAATVSAWITGPDGQRVAELAVSELGPGLYEARWEWSSSEGWEVAAGIPVGEYRAHVRSSCLADTAQASLFVVFDPEAFAAPAAYGFDRTAVWFGMGRNAAYGLHYYLHCSDWRVFRIALGAAAGHTDPYLAAIAIARAEEALFGYSLNYQTNDVLDLLLNYREAQCADDAACLTAMLRALGIAAHPVTADAALETGDANWTFDTWVEFLAAPEQQAQWLVLHPHEYPGMQPEPREVFGRRGVANKDFNDLIITADPSWGDFELDDGAVNVAYRRSACGEPLRTIARSPWVAELCESGYWPQAHWDCGEEGARRLVAARGVRMSVREAALGEELGGTVSLRNAGPLRQFGRVVLELVLSRMESKSFVEKVLYTTELPMVLDPLDSLLFPFSCTLPAALAPGRALYLRVLVNERTVLIEAVRLPAMLQARLEMPALWRQGSEAALRLIVGNVSPLPLHAVGVGIAMPYGLAGAGPGPAPLGTLEAGEVRELAFSLRAIAAMASGSLHIALSCANGAGLLLRRPFRIEAGHAISTAAPS